MSSESETPRAYFTLEAALGLVGQGVRSRLDFSGVPKGTAGRVIRADEAAARERYLVAVEWDLPQRIAPRVDWFRRDEFERYLEPAPDAPAVVTPLGTG